MTIDPDGSVKIRYNPKKADIWALGVIAYMMAGLVTPFRNNENIKCGYYRLSPIESYSVEFKYMIHLCFKVDPKERAVLPNLQAGTKQKIEQLVGMSIEEYSKVFKQEMEQEMVLLCQGEVKILKKLPAPASIPYEIIRIGVAPLQEYTVFDVSAIDFDEDPNGFYKPNSYDFDDDEYKLLIGNIKETVQAAV